MSKRIKPNPFKKAGKECRYIKPPIAEIPDRYVKFDYAKDFARQIKIGKGERICAVVNGSFVFGDFIEALMIENQLRAKKMTLSTLSYNDNNVDSLKTLMVKGYCDNLNIIVSDYFFGHERRGMIPYTYHELDNDNDTFQLAVDRTHCKVYIWETYFNEYYVIQGSVNLRSSGNSENFTIEENEQLYRWYDEYLQGILDRQKSIDKSLKYKKLWQIIVDQENGRRTTVPLQSEQSVQLADEEIPHHLMGERGTRECQPHSKAW